MARALLIPFLRSVTGGIHPGSTLAQPAGAGAAEPQAVLRALLFAQSSLESVEASRWARLTVVAPVEVWSAAREPTSPEVTRFSRCPLEPCRSSWAAVEDES